MKPPMPYPGGKQRIAKRIAEMFPAHSHYIEPFAGALSVLLAKPPSPLETVSDIDGDITNFWRILRDLDGYLNRIAPCAARLRKVTLENRPALDIIRIYQQPGVLIYYEPQPTLFDTDGRTTWLGSK